MTRRGLLGFAITAGLWAAVGTSARTPQGQGAAGAAQVPTFRSRIDSVSVDVSVSDKQGRPVVDLQASDFEIRESKQLQKVEAFKLIRVDDAAPPDPMRTTLSDQDQERELARDGTRLIVVYLDDYHTSKVNALRIRAQLARFISGLGGNDLVALMAPLTPAASLVFAYNHAVDARTVSAFEGRKYDYTPRNAVEAQYQQLPADQIEQMRNRTVLTSLEALTTYLGIVRDGRKMVLFVSEGLQPSVPASVTFGPPSPAALTSSNALDIQLGLERVYRAAARANVSISVLDPRGLAMTEGMPADPVAMEQDRQALRDTADQLRTLAGQTDGRAMVGTNDPQPGLQQMTRDLSAYYLLGYTPTSPHDGKFHEIQVKVNRKDVEVHARKGYWARTEDEIAKASAPAKPAVPRDVVEALGTLSSAGDSADHRLVHAWMGAARGASDKAVVTLVWETASATPPAEPADRVDHVTVTATSIYGDTLFNGRVAADAQAGRPTGRVTFEAPAGAVRARVVAENAKGLRLEDQDVTLDVPDVAAGNPVITAPAVYRGRTVRDIQLLRADASAVPAVTREFSRTERLLLRFQVYGPAGVAPAVTMQLLNREGGVMAALPPPTATADHGYEADIGLGPFPAGTFVIEIDADFAGTKTRTLLAIRVTG